MKGETKFSALPIVQKFLGEFENLLARRFSRKKQKPKNKKTSLKLRIIERAVEAAEAEELVVGAHFRCSAVADHDYEVCVFDR